MNHRQVRRRGAVRKGQPQGKRGGGVRGVAVIKRTRQDKHAASDWQRATVQRSATS
jgi:hypothetical protein